MPSRLRTHSGFLRQALIWPHQPGQTAEDAHQVGEITSSPEPSAPTTG